MFAVFILHSDYEDQKFKSILLCARGFGYSTFQIFQLYVSRQNILQIKIAFNCRLNISCHN